MTSRRFLIAGLLFLLGSFAVSAAEWFDHYEDGLKAADKGQWQVVVQKMSAAISAQPNENKRARTYGNVFIAYHPYYYRGVAYFELGEYEKAVADLEKTSGVGRVKLQSADTLLMRAQSRLAPPPAQTASAPPPTTTQAQPSVTTTQQPAVTTPPPVSRPAVDPAIARMKTRAQGLLAQADRAQAQARQKNAVRLAPTQYVRATETLAEARTRVPAAGSADDWKRIGDLAEQSRGLFDSSVAEAEVQIARRQTAPTQAADDVLSDTRKRVLSALQDYFDGRFDRSAREFELLARNELKRNPMIWVFLGASQYSKYYMEGERTSADRAAAEDSFRTARRLNRNLRLPASYFSPRIREFYENVR